MIFLFTAPGLMILGALGALFSGRRNRQSAVFGLGGLAAGSLVFAVLLGRTFMTGAPLSSGYSTSRLFGDLALRLDSLSGVFLLPILLLSTVCGFYGLGYLKSSRNNERNLGTTWFWYNLLAAAMAGVCLAGDFLTLAVCWELMTLSSYFLVTFEHDNPQVRKAGMIYLIASHCSIALLLPGFLLLSTRGGSLLFPAELLEASLPGASAVFLLTFIGFGIKAGFFPAHVWLPEAHPAAPSHVSALLSGGMINLGAYGILRICSFFTLIPLWWGAVIILTGSVTAFLGILYSLGQRDLKKILAYSSVENLGIVALGIGTGLIGVSTGNGTVSVLGFSGALLHMLNHGIFKGLLFLGAGSVFHGTGIRDIERLGGLVKPMKKTAAAMFIGAAALCALPPFGGAVSEFLLYLGVFRGITQGGGATEILFLAAGGSFLALTGGLVLLSFTRLMGITFLGLPRDPAVQARESKSMMTVPMGILAITAALTGIGAPVFMKVLLPAVENVAGAFPENPVPHVTALVRTLAFALGGLSLLILLVLLIRKLLLAGKDVRTGETWGCGYLFPTPKIQYTGTSFAHPVATLFKGLSFFKETLLRPKGLFPKTSSCHSEHPDPSARFFLTPLFKKTRRLFGALMFIQHGRVHDYVLYIVVTLIILLLWNLR